MTAQFLAVLASLAAGLGLGALGRALLRSRVRLSWSDAIVAGLVGALVGTLFAAVAEDLGAGLPVVSGLVAVGVTLAILAAMERWQARRRLPRGRVAELVARGESKHVEFNRPRAKTGTAASATSGSSRSSPRPSLGSSTPRAVSCSSASPTTRPSPGSRTTTRC